MRILVLSDGFSAPAYKPRLRSLCSYLVSAGHQLTVFAEQADELDFTHSYDIVQLQIYKGQGAIGKIDWAWKNLLTMLFNYKEKRFLHLVEKQIDNSQFDLVFCTSFHSFPLHAANQIAKRRNIPCVVDLRDIVEQAPQNKFQYLRHNSKILQPFANLYVSLAIKRRNKEIKRADAVTTVSPWHCEVLRKYNPNTYLIYNGYDCEQFFPKDKLAKEFQIVYTGKIFPYPHQDISLFFEALSSLDLPELKVCFYTNRQGENIIRKQIRQYSIDEGKITILPFVAQAEVADLLHKSSICLVLTNKSSDTSVHGMMTTKFFEALGVEKPVLCVRSDEECLAQVINQTNAGKAAKTAEDVRDFILLKYAEWKEQGYTRQQVNKEAKLSFSRQAEAAEFERVFNRVCM